MVTPLKSANTIDFNRIRQQAAVEHDYPDPDGGQQEQQRFQLLSRLQTTLSLETIIHLLYTSLEEQFGLQGLRYLHEARSLQMLEGKAMSHSCGYHLHTRQGDLGEVILYRNRRFSDSELLLIE